MTRPYDEHDACRQEIAYWQKKVEEHVPIAQVIREHKDGCLEHLAIVRVDVFHEGLRILVR